MSPTGPVVRYGDERKEILCPRCDSPSNKCDHCGRKICRHLTIKRDGKDSCGPCHLKQHNAKRKG